MSGTVFVDTNVLVYVRDATDPEKQRRAAQWMAALWSSRRGRLSWQVLEEYYITATRKLEPPRDPDAAREELWALRAWRPIGTRFSTLESAWSAQDRYGLSWWDALIVAAALESGCRTLLTEDLQNGQRIDGLQIVDPFLNDPETVLGSG